MHQTLTLPAHVDPSLSMPPPAFDAAPPVQASAPFAQVHETPLAFDGTGADYFRLWIVHTLLNVLTVGVYSPWAKVRKARWFAQHTMLLGERFDYHGRPLPILAGRVIALLLFVLWTWSFDISRWLGLAVLGLLCGIGPLLFASAQRFRLANTSWRGLRFDFAVPRRSLFAVCVPALLLWTAATVLQAWGARPGLVVLASALGTLCLPWAHGRLKWMQHSNASFGGRRFSFDVATWPFYKVYFTGFFALVGATLVAFLAGFWVARIAAGDYGERVGVGSGFVTGLLTALVVWVLAWPYFAARLQQLVWSRTHWGDVGFWGSMRAWRMLRIVLVGVALTILTLGLYWPFFSVAMAKYRVETLAVVSDRPLSGLDLQGAPAASRAATGDAAADFFGLDLGW